MCNYSEGKILWCIALSRLFRMHFFRWWHEINLLLRAVEACLQVGAWTKEEGEIKRISRENFSIHIHYSKAILMEFQKKRGQLPPPCPLASNRPGENLSIAITYDHFWLSFGRLPPPCPLASNTLLQCITTVGSIRKMTEITCIALFLLDFGESIQLMVFGNWYCGGRGYSGCLGCQTSALTRARAYKA